MNFPEFVMRLKTWGMEYFGLYYGHYFGQVVDIDDPDNMGRVRVQCDALWGEEAPENIWCVPAYGPTGAAAGLWWPVKVNDHVWVTCRYGRPTSAEYRGGWWTIANKPDYSNDQRGLISPAGWKIIFDDENEVAEISSPEEKVKFELNHSSGSVVVTADKVSLGSDAASQPVPLGNQLMAWLASHTHTAPTGLTTPPVNAADLPNTVSKKVFGE